jgi:hypothetical protein
MGEDAELAVELSAQESLGERLRVRPTPLAGRQMKLLEASTQNAQVTVGVVDHPSGLLERGHGMLA